MKKHNIGHAVLWASILPLASCGPADQTNASSSSSVSTEHSSVPQNAQRKTNNPPAVSKNLGAVEIELAPESMPLVIFWKIMEAPASIRGDDIEQQEKMLDAELQKLSDDELVGFNRTYDRIHNAAYKWDLWEAAFFISGGCSDDGFTYFRNWVIGRGRVAYGRILENPDNLADYSLGDDPVMTAQCVEWDLLPGQIWETRDSSRDDNQWFDLWYERPDMIQDPVGENFDEDDLDGFKARFPRLAEKYSHLWG